MTHAPPQMERRRMTPPWFNIYGATHNHAPLSTSTVATDCHRNNLGLQEDDPQRSAFINEVLCRLRGQKPEPQRKAA